MRLGADQSLCMLHHHARINDNIERALPEIQRGEVGSFIWQACFVTDYTGMAMCITSSLNGLKSIENRHTCVQQELLKYFEIVSGNRSLIIKVSLPAPRVCTCGRLTTLCVYDCRYFWF